ncbi:MAG: adenylosuccinate lyase, partial [Phycisphaerae bacterium]
EAIRTHSQAAAYEVKAEGRENDLLARLKADPLFKDVDIDAELEPSRFIGRAPEQVDAFLAEHVAPILAAHPAGEGLEAEIHV